MLTSFKKEWRLNFEMSRERLEELEHTELTSHVNVKGNWIPTDLVTFLDISEDFQGYDVMTFMFNEVQYQSRITNRPL